MPAAHCPPPSVLCPLFSAHCPLPTVPCPLSTVCYMLSVVHHRLSAFCPPLLPSFPNGMVSSLDHHQHTFRWKEGANSINLLQCGPCRLLLPPFQTFKLKHHFAKRVRQHAFARTVLLDMQCVKSAEKDSHCTQSVLPASPSHQL